MRWPQNNEWAAANNLPDERIEIAVADPEKLASNGLMAFAGFFDVSHRKHDYDYGRSVAQRLLAEYKLQLGSVFSNLHWTPKTIDPIDENLNNIQISQVDKTKRQEVYDQWRRQSVAGGTEG